MARFMEDEWHRTFHVNARYCIVNPPQLMIHTAASPPMSLRRFLIRFTEVSLSKSIAEGPCFSNRVPFNFRSSSMSRMTCKVDGCSLLSSCKVDSVGRWFSLRWTNTGILRWTRSKIIIWFTKVTRNIKTHVISFWLVDWNCNLCFCFSYSMEIYLASDVQTL